MTSTLTARATKPLTINDIDTTECVNLGDLSVKRKQTEG